MTFEEAQQQAKVNKEYIHTYVVDGIWLKFSYVPRWIWSKK